LPASGGTSGYETAVVEDGDGVAHTLNVTQNMCAVKDGRVLFEAFHHFQDVTATHRVQRGRGLVEDQ
jgi:hypothetical protein